MTMVIYRGGEGETYTFEGPLSAILENVHAGDNVDIEVTVPEPENAEPEVEPEEA